MTRKNIFVPLWFKISAKLDESILIERLRRNDRKAYSELFDGYFDKLFTFALNMVFREDVANDIVQEVFIAIYEKSVLKNYQGSLKAYLYTSVRNRCYNYGVPRRGGSLFGQRGHDRSGGDSGENPGGAGRVTGKMPGSVPSSFRAWVQVQRDFRTVGDE